MRKYFSFILLWVGLFSCRQEKMTSHSDGSLLDIDDNTEFGVIENTKLSSVFKNSRIVELETNENSLIGGRGNKVMKYKSRFYVLSHNTILIFDNNGEFIGKLNHIGNGPEDYPAIYDYDVLKDELWIGTANGIMIYDIVSLGFKRKIPIEGFVNQFEYVNDTTLIIRSPEDMMFKICDQRGKVRKRFIEKDLPNDIQEFHQFCRIGDKTIYHLASTQSGVVYDSQSDSMYYQNILFGDRLLTPQINRDYYEKYGYMEQFQKASEDYIRLSTIRQLKDNILLTKIYPNKTHELFLISQDKQIRFCYAGSDVSIENDIVLTNAGMSFLTSITCCESEDSFLFLIGPETLEMDNILEDSNPCILEVFP